MLWIKALHIIFMVTWFAGIFYLPRLFVYHAMAQDEISLARFKIMERKLYYGIMWPGAVLTLIFGAWLVSYNWQAYLQAGWLHAKLFLVLLLIAFNFYCGKLRKDFFYDRNKHGHVFYRWINEAPVALLFLIIILAVVKPF